METVLNWTWPFEETFRFYLVQFFFWSGYAFLAGLVGTLPYYFTKYRQTAWSTYVLGSMGTLITYLSQFLFGLDKPLDMVCPFAVLESTLATVLLAPFVSIFAFVFRSDEEEFLDDFDYDDELDDEYEGRVRRSRLVRQGRRARVGTIVRDDYEPVRERVVERTVVSPDYTELPSAVAVQGVRRRKRR